MDPIAAISMHVQNLSLATPWVCSDAVEFWIPHGSLSGIGQSVQPHSVIVEDAVAQTGLTAAFALGLQPAPSARFFSASSNHQTRSGVGRAMCYVQGLRSWCTH